MKIYNSIQSVSLPNLSGGVYKVLFEQDKRRTRVDERNMKAETPNVLVDDIGGDNAQFP